MKKYLNFLIAVLMIISNCNLQSAPFDTGMISLTQPNDLTFTGRIWGDEFIFWMETENGYRFVQTFDGWFYYATLDQNGEYAPTNYKVGIDSPPASSYQLERSQARLNEIEEQIEQFNEQIELNRQWFAQKQAEADANQEPVTMEVGIVLIEFQDVKHFENETNRPDGYLTADFDSLMFSYNYWYDITSPTPHPENELIFGSFRDYWYQMSRGNLRIEGRVANPTDENGVPVWITAKDSIKFYADDLLIYTNDWDTLADEAITEALENNWIDTSDENNENYFDNIVVVYAGPAKLMGALKVKGGIGLGSNWIFLAERSTRKLYLGDVPSFTHIGIYAHEFGHNLGLPEEYYDPGASILDLDQNGNSSSIFNFCLMAMGIYNGPNEKGECPATLSPYHRIKKNWVNSVTIDEDTVNFLVEYDYENPKFYRINPVGAIDEHYIMETRKRTGFDLYIPGDPADSTNQAGRLIVWHHDIQPYPYTTEVDRILIKPADGIFDNDTQLEDFFPAQFNPGFQNLNDITSPAATLGRIYVESPLISNERPAHFTFNGIQKLGNGNTLIAEVKPNQATVKNVNSGGWQTLSVPVGLTDYSLASVFPTAISAYKFSGSYIRVYTLENELGYWTNFPVQQQNLILAGSVMEHLEIPVNSGWNLVGTISDKIIVENVCSEPEGIIENIYKYRGGYVRLESNDILYPGIGYWIKTTASGNIILDRYTESCELSKITSYPQIDLSLMDKFIITDSAGYSQSLYVSNIDIDTTLTSINLDLPPLFPEMEFDSRFEHNEFVKKVSADSGTIDLTILVQTNAYPINLTWEINPANGIEYSFISDSGLGKISFLNKKLTIGENSKGKIKLFGKVDNSYSNNLPDKFEMYQNFPNPFNPVTIIKYDLVKVQDVKVTVYDILGRQVTTLVNEQQMPGSYEVKWDASFVSSGIYFYQLRTKDFVDTKKMILIK